MFAFSLFFFLWIFLLSYVQILTLYSWLLLLKLRFHDRSDLLHFHLYLSHWLLILNFSDLIQFFLPFLELLKIILHLDFILLNLWFLTLQKFLSFLTLKFFFYIVVIDLGNLHLFLNIKFSLLFPCWWADSSKIACWLGFPV